MDQNIQFDKDRATHLIGHEAERLGRHDQGKARKYARAMVTGSGVAAAKASRRKPSKSRRRTRDDEERRTAQRREQEPREPERRRQGISAYTQNERGTQEAPSQENDSTRDTRPEPRRQQERTVYASGRKQAELLPEGRAMAAAGFAVRDFNRFHELVGSTPSPQPLPGKKGKTVVATGPRPPKPGFIAAKHESDVNPGSIGYDAKGGTSYGLYQITSAASSKTGKSTMDDFLAQLERNGHADWAERLRNAGEMNTGGKDGAFPDEWRKIAQEEPMKFAQAQHKYIEATHYRPAVNEIKKRTGLDLEHNSNEMREAIWSTSIQHGPRKTGELFARAKSALEESGQEVNERNLVGAVYDERKTDFGSSSKPVRESVQNRIEREKGQLILAMDWEPSGPSR